MEKSEEQPLYGARWIVALSGRMAFAPPAALRTSPLSHRPDQHFGATITRG
jgi:hypothetical protein